MSKQAVLLINLGTPDHCEAKSVRRYLKEFLNDPRVIDLPTVMRWLLVNLIIVPFRYKKSAMAYQKIWQKQGSPLGINSQQLAQALSIELGENYQFDGIREHIHTSTSNYYQIANYEHHPIAFCL